jgi:hypothetical protein
MKRGLLKSSCPEARATLEMQEEMLIEALLEGKVDGIPVSAPQVAAGVQSLLLKRARAIARAHPEVLDKGSEAFIASMRRYAALYPGIHPHGCCADAAQYLQICQTRLGGPTSIRSSFFQTLAELITRWRSMRRSF